MKFIIKRDTLKVKNSVECTTLTILCNYDLQFKIFPSPQNKTLYLSNSFFPFLPCPAPGNYSSTTLLPIYIDLFWIFHMNMKQLLSLSIVFLRLMHVLIVYIPLFYILFLFFRMSFSDKSQEA